MVNHTSHIIYHKLTDYAINININVDSVDDILIDIVISNQFSIYFSMKNLT